MKYIKRGDTSCTWCKGFGLALSNRDDKKKEVQKCDECDVFRTDSEAKLEIRNYPETMRELGISREHTFFKNK